MNNRLLSLDIFRGITIFFMIIVNTPGSWNFVYAPLLHATWSGCTPTDLIFPFFLFIVGASMAFSYNKYENKDPRQWIWKAIKRGSVIVIIGLLLNWFPFYTKNIANLRFFGVLQRIGLAFTAGALLISMVKERHLWYVLSAILISYWLIIITAGQGDVTLEGNIIRKTDLAIFGANHIYKGYGIPFDPEGLLSTLPAVGSVILGFIIGSVIIRNDSFNKRIRIMAGYGILCASLGLIWHWIGFPLNKPIWSSSYVLFTGGWAIIFLSVLTWIIDVKAITKWAEIFKPFGVNPLASFVMSVLLVKMMLLFKVNDQNLYNWFYSALFQPTFGNYFGSLMFALFFTGVIWFMAWILYRKSIFIKI